MLQKHIGFLLTLIATLLFFPGILMPMFSLNMELAGALSGASMGAELVNKELSIIGTVAELLHESRYLVALLIFAFSVLIPIFKTSIVFIVYFSKNLQFQKKLARFVASIGKWSMADVFVVAIFLAVMSTNHAQSKEEYELSFLGMSVAFEISTQTLSNVGLGFYYFVAYCLLSLLGSHLLLSAIQKPRSK
ncbi:paraquat-inducible protein A [Glaciecola sp. MH2013]|uniref:paraquat-inducible protein A n=1 Tax=Glaciecola sp. MH2013 TaxID=2785524 RepID=UPI0018A070B4|nr:paraquat-inducible protein A [Glaciecola sp. MH2013]MBF7071824.1 paraquat-inducible protein A [Glaciecola sp. MH2013]